MCLCVCVRACVRLLSGCVGSVCYYLRNAGIEHSTPEYWTKGFHLTCKPDGSLAIPNFLQAVAEPVSAPPAVCLHQHAHGDGGSVCQNKACACLSADLVSREVTGTYP